MKYAQLVAPWRALFTITTALLGMGTLSHRTLAATYEVSPSGNDNNVGTAAAPWKTIQKAALTVQAGDTVLINDGTYAGFRMRTSGTAASRITFKSKNKWGAKVTSPNPYADADHITVLSASFVTIDGLEVTGSSRAGIGVRTMFDATGADTQGNIVQNCYSHDNGLPSGGAHDGIFTGFALNFTAQYNVCDHNGEHGIYISNSADNPIVRGNQCTNNRACGIQLNADASTTIDGEGDGLINNWLVEGNVISGNGTSGGAGINLDGDVNGICRNNLITNNLSTGIALYQIDGAQPSNHNLIVNNTIYNPNSTRSALLMTNGANNNVVFNNILIPNVGMEVGTVSGFQHDYNIVNSYDGATASAHESNASPASLFAAPTSDFHLATISPAKDSGVATFGGASVPTIDIESNTRPQGAAFDRGCYEATSQANPTPTPAPTATPTPVPTATPTPTNTYGRFKFSAANYSMSEGGGHATIAVQRMDGTDGAVSVHYATVNGGTATAGSDYTTTQGLLNFAAGDGSVKTFQVPILEDALSEGNETVKLQLYTPTGGATLDATLKLSTLTIADNEAENVPPSVAFTQPLNNSFANNLNLIAGTANDTGGSGLHHVSLQILRQSDGLWWSGTTWGSSATLLPTQLTNGTWIRNTGNPAGAYLPVGTYILRAWAYDGAGNSRVAPILVTIERTLPTVSLNNPPNNARLNSLTSIIASASDENGIASVGILIKRESDKYFWSGSTWTADVVYLPAHFDGSHWALNSGLPPEFLSHPPLPSPVAYRIYAKATDKAGNSQTVSTLFYLTSPQTKSNNFG